MDRGVKVLSSVGLALGAIFGLAGTFAQSASLRGLAWGIDGLGIVMASAFAVLRLTTSSNVPGCSIGRSPGRAPFAILST